MAFKMPWIVFSSDKGSLIFATGFVLGSLTCLIFRIALDWAHNLRKWSEQNDKVFNMDAAEKGGLKVRTKILLDDDLFSLEKRAFFSQVGCRCSPASPSPLKRAWEMLVSNIHLPDFVADDAAVMALRMPS